MEISRVKCNIFTFLLQRRKNMETTNKKNIIFACIFGFLAIMSIYENVLISFIFFGGICAFFIFRCLKSSNTDNQPPKTTESNVAVPKIYIDPLTYRAYSYDCAMDLLRKIKESADIVNNTVNPETFFKRLHWILNYLIYLAQYEKKIKFTGELPSTAYIRIVNNLEQTVDDFIKRAYNAELEKISKLKTESAKQKRIMKFLSDMEYYIEYSDDFRNVVEPNIYYTGALYTPQNLETVRKLIEAVENSIFV